MSPSVRMFLAIIAAFTWLVPAVFAVEEPKDKIFFNRDVRPILADNCFHCHGPDPGSRKAKMRFDREDGLFAVHGDGAVVARGQPEQSLLYQRVTSSDPDERMPPAEKHKALSVAQVDTLKRWIEQGATWEPHWSLVKPQRPEIPTVVKARWVRNPIDSFVLATLEAAKLEPSPEADRRTIARRLALDLTGLPPEPAEVEAFVADASPDAYEKLVDRWMATPRYGEHRARYWLDAVRYADTHGLHFDNHREIWPYRDWVIEAFNRNMPFDRFTIEQIAGDLLPDPTIEQLIATGLHRCNVTTSEGGTIDAETLASYARDRVETTSWVFLGLTANCAVCHDHKFDPLPTRDFYAMTAFFRNTTQAALDGNTHDTAPSLPVPRQQDLLRSLALTQEVAVAKREVEQRKKAVRERYHAKLAGMTAETWSNSLHRLGEAALHLPLTGALAGTIGGLPIIATAKETIVWATGGVFGDAASITDRTELTASGAFGDFERDQSYSLGCWVKLPSNVTGTAALLSRMDDGDGYRGWDIFVQGDQIATHLINRWSDDALKIHTTGNVVKRDAWQHVFVTYDGTSKASGLKIYVDGELQPTTTDADTLKHTTRTTAPFFVGRRKNLDILKAGQIQDVRIYGRQLDAIEIKLLADTPRALAILAKAAAERTVAERDFLFATCELDDDTVRAALDTLRKLESEANAIRARGGLTLIQQEKPGSAAMAQVLVRGQYDQPGETVAAGVFSALPPLPPDAPKNRLGLARWLVSADNPLTARVTVNRLWQEFFGVGLVRTTEDFGIMGDAPSHPALLDHLAVQFRDGGWDMKDMVRTIVTSATYRQSPIASGEQRERDPANRLLSRGPRFRMDAEMVRDHALSAAGILSSTMGGPGVKPYQPAHIWDVVGLPEGNTRHYQQDHGDNLYRRSVYSYWKRQAPPPAMELFNAPSRETSCLRRERTNTPLQALVTLNDPQFIEAARMLAQKALAMAGDDHVRLDFVVRRVLGRPFTAPEMRILMQNLDDLRAHYGANPNDARALIAVGEAKADASIDVSELAAMALICSEVFNLDEALTK